MTVVGFAISVTYAFELAQRSGAIALGETEQAYVARTCSLGFLCRKLTVD